MNAFILSRSRALSALAPALLAAALVAACGGGTSQVEPFEARRVIAVGDESSLLEANGRKWSVNSLNTETNTVSCADYPLWVQSVANLYSFAFAQCNPNNLTTLNGLMQAARNAKVADLAGQVSTLTLGTGDLVTVMAGANDVIELQQAVAAGTRTETEALAEASARGKALAGFINGLVAKDARVIVSTIFNMGLTPYGIPANEADLAGVATQTLLTNLSTALNTAMRVNVLNDGRFIALVLADEEQVRAMRFPSVLSLDTTNVLAVTAPACATALPDCLSNALVEGATATTWLWADDKRAGMRMQERLGALAVARARANPF